MMFSRTKSTAIAAAVFHAFLTTALIGAESYIFVDGSCGNDAWTGTNCVCFGPDGYKHTIQAALDAIPDGGVVVVRAGTYTGEGNRDLDFHGKAVRLVGYECIIDCGGTPTEEHRAFNFHSGETQSSTIESFTIINGRAWKGGAVLCTNSSPKFIGCTFRNNEATDDDAGGGAIYNEDSSPTLEGCAFADNQAMPSASYGGAITNKRSSPTLTDCSFTGNRAWGGGGIYNTDNSNPVLENCTFLNNQAARGAGMGNSQSSPTLSRCAFTGNSATDFAGGMYDTAGSNPTLTHCIFTGNSAGNGGAMSNGNSGPAIVNCLFTGNTAASHGGAVSNDSSTTMFINCTIYGNAGPSGGGVASYDQSKVTITNSILWGNTPNQIYSDDPACHEVLFSCVQDGWSGAGNIGGNPLFTDPDGPDDALGTEDDDLTLATDSPCIDAGDNSAAPTLLIDLGGLARRSDDPIRPDTGNGTPPIIDMGVYEYQGLFYVDDSALGANNGTSWENAFTSLQDALAAAPSGAEIRLAQGIYRPDSGEGITSGNREATFEFPSDLAIRGGYAGFGASDPDARNINEYPTILTGDLAGNDEILADPAELLEHPSRSENSLHIITIGQNTQNVLLEGFTITGGNANGDYASRTDSGAGICKHHYQSSAVITRCTFIANSAVRQGGGVLNDGPLTVDRCRFLGNFADSGGAMENNANWDDPATLTNCVLTGNRASSHGGAIATTGSAIRCTNCTFSLNRAQGAGFYRGGGITGDDDTYMWLTNCIFWGNSDTNGMVESSQIFQDYISQTHVNYCCVQGWTGILSGEGNFGNDPEYVDPDGTDNIPGTEDDNLRLSAGSPCIDSGDPEYAPEPGETDLDGCPRILNSTVDMGAYENQGGTPEGGVIYVDDSATGANTGLNWPNAFNHIQDALAIAQSGDEIRIAQGTYRPDRGAGITRYDRQATFQLKSNVTIKGGYAGFGSPAPNDRDIEEYPTILSGDLDGDDGPDCTGCSENSFHIVTAADAQEAVLDGLTITAGNANGSYPHNNGGGIVIDVPGGSPVLIDCTISNNYAESGGGGLYVRLNAVVRLTRCTFFGNKSGYTGGAFYNYKGQDIQLYLCTFRGNSAANAGALSNFLGSMTVRNCIFTGNTAQVYSGGQGGAMRHWGNSSADRFTLINSTISGNSATGIDGQGRCGGLHVQDGPAKIDNCILWNNSDGQGQGESAQILDTGGESVLSNCCIQGFTGGGTANIGDDPLLVDPDGPDNVLGTEDDNLRLLPGSPCLDAGNNSAVSEPFTEDMDGNPRIQNDIVDIGAYEGASPAIIVEPQFITVPEGYIVSFYVHLSSDPGGPIEVAMTHSGDIDIELETGPRLYFDSSNYHIPQPVELIGAGDADSLNGTAMIYLTALGFFPAGVTATELDSQSSAVLYVDNDAAPHGTGTSWATAFSSLQDALSAVIAYPQFNEIRVAQGTYKPDRGAGITPGSRDATFQLINNVTLKGGYAGLSGPDPDARDVAAYQTVLSGDLAGNDIEVADPNQLLDEPTRDENSRNVVTATNCGNTAVIDGFTVTGGNADGPAEAQKYGGGIYNGMPTVRNCTIIGNSADIGGGAIYFYYGLHGLVADSIVTHNAAPTGGGIYGCPALSNCVINANAATAYSGGGVFLGQGCDTTVTDCTFSNNTAVTYGGGVMLGVSDSRPIFTRCAFIANSTGGSGGAVASDGCTCGSYPEFYQCTFTGNTADASGGGVYSFGYSLPRLFSCLLTGNHSGTNGGAFSHGWGADSYFANCTITHNTAGEWTGGIFYEDSSSNQEKTVANCIIWGNSGGISQTLQDQQILALGTSSIPSVNYSCIEGWTGMGGTGSVGNTAQNPKFVDADGPDGIPGNEDDNLRLQADSPCVNKGSDYYVSPESEDLDGNPRISGGRVDMGAYESSSPGEPARYDIIDLGTLGGEESMAHAINNDGQIVGWARRYPHAISACLFDFRNPANNIDLDPYGGDSSGAYSINIHGVPVGMARETQASPFNAALYNPTDPCDNVNLNGSELLLSSAESINDLGQIVGWAQLPSGGYTAILFDPSGAGDNLDLVAGALPNPNGHDASKAYAINNEGQIVGHALMSAPPVVERAVLFDATGAGNHIILTPDEDDGGEALSINDAGQIVGWAVKTGGATIFNQVDPGNNLALGAVPGAIGSKAHCINNRGQTVGSVHFWEEGLSYYSHAAIFDPTGNGDNRDLNNLIDHNTGWELTEAYGINDSGWIVGYGRYEGGTRAFLLIPRQSQRLMAHWKLDESEGDIAEDSAGDNDGTLRGGPLWLPNEGRVDGALLFDGTDDYVDCGNSSDFDITDQITVAAWVNISAVNTDWQTVVAKGDSAWRLSTAEDACRYHFAVTGGPPWNYINGETEVQPGEWRHVCGTYDGAYLRLYIDGIQDPAGPVAEANGVTTSDHAVYIGENQERPGRSWDGLIDDVRVYNYALTRAEISQFCKIDVLYVDKDAPGRNNGCCWGDAFQCLQDAIATATDGTEIRVAEGSYSPDCGEGITSGDREATFQLKNGVTIKGGYAGHGQPEPNARNINEYQTILSGDLAGNDGPGFANFAENSYHIVTGSGTDATAVIDGFTITHGGVVQNDECGDQNRGGGLYNLSGSPTVLNCTFIANAATDNCGGGGAAIYNRDNSNPTVKNCTFTANEYTNANDDGGGAVRNYRSNPVFEDCTFTDNASEGYGGAILNHESNPTLNRCIFVANFADYTGGAIANEGSSPVMNNCTFIENSSVQQGGAVINDHLSSPVFSACFFTGNSATGNPGNGGAVCNSHWDEAKFSQCLFAGNSASSGGAIYSYHGSAELVNCTFTANAAGRGGGIHCLGESTVLTNCILWGNTAEQGKDVYYRFLDEKSGTLTISYTNIRHPDFGIHIEPGNTLDWGPGNITADPCFADPENGDYHLKSTGWRWDPGWQEWTFDRVTSRCIDAGNPASPLLDEPLSVPEDPNNEYAENIRINMGAYGGTAEASLPPIGWSLLADINNDGMVNFCDFAYAGADWNASAPQLPGDLDRNKSASPPDLSLFADNWLRQTTWKE